jgi:hypothetical protein
MTSRPFGPPARGPPGRGLGGGAAERRGGPDPARAADGAVSAGWHHQGMTTGAATWRRVHRQRFATQRLSAAGTERAADAVRLLAAAQAQDAPLAAWSLAQRTRGTPSHDEVLAEQAAGGWVRTHVLRPTWHFVAPEDLRWMQRATAPRVLTGLTGRHRQLGIDADVRRRGRAVLESTLGGRVAATRREIGAACVAAGLPGSGPMLGHLLMIAELELFIVSGPPHGAEHTYLLADDALPTGPMDHLPPADGRRELARRFVASHGPVSDRDLARWCSLTLDQARRALAELSTSLESVDIDSETLWFDPTMPSRTTSSRQAYLLPTFDEVRLSYLTSGPPRRAPAVDRVRLVSEHGGGVIIVDGDDVGVWNRYVERDRVRLRIQPDVKLTPDELDAVGSEATRLAAFLGGGLDLETAAPPAADHR